MKDLYHLAQSRVRETPELADDEGFILADWPEGDDHLLWVLNAPLSEIVGWVEAGRDG